MIYFTEIHTPIGEIQLVRDERYLLRLFLPNETITEKDLKNIYSNTDVIETKVGFDKVIKQLSEYFDGKRKYFTLEFKLEIPQFYRKALREIANVPYGKVTSYSAIAQKLMNPKATRAIGTANAKNPIPIIIPCHRVISKNGNLGGYRGGWELKIFLQELESKVNL